MLFPEHNFQPPIISAPDHQTGGLSSGPQLESPYPSSLVEALSIEQSLEVLQSHASAVLGLASQPVSPAFERIQSFLVSQTVPIDAAHIRAKRREEFEQTGYVPSIIGGQDRKKLNKLPLQPDLQRWPQTAGYPPGSDEYRQFRAREMGLREDVTWGEIGDILNQEDMIAIARELGFSEKQIERVSWHAILMEGVLGLAGNEPVEKVIQKIKEVK